MFLAPSDSKRQASIERVLATTPPTTPSAIDPAGVLRQEGSEPLEVESGPEAVPTGWELAASPSRKANLNKELVKIKGSARIVVNDGQIMGFVGEAIDLKQHEPNRCVTRYDQGCRV
jgi:hypothetical protein